VSEFASLGRMLIAFGVALLIVGAVLTFVGKVPRLPGDILIRRDSVVIYIPLATSIVLSVLLTLALSLIARR